MQRAIVPLVLAALTIAPVPVMADTPSGVEASPTEDGVLVGVTDHMPGDAQVGEPASISPPSADPSGAVTVSMGTILEDEFCDGTNWTESCTPEPSSPDVEAPPTVTPGMVATAFAELPLPASVLVVQPPDGRTLVNFATNFYTESEPFTEVVRLLGQRVELRIWPSRFTWVFGDGASAATSSPGAAYPALEVTHEYRRAGRVAPRVDTTYAAEFRVNGGAWAPVAGTVTIPGEPVGLRVETATPVLVAYE